MIPMERSEDSGQSIQITWTELMLQLNFLRCCLFLWCSRKQPCSGLVAHAQTGTTYGWGLSSFPCEDSYEGFVAWALL